MYKVLRVWKESKCSKGVSNWTIWDRGDEIWELKSDTLRRFEVLERRRENNIITELLRPLRESAIPLEAIRHSIQGWEVEDSIESVPVVQPLPQAKPELPLTSFPLSIPIPSLQTHALLKAKKLEQGEHFVKKKGTVKQDNTYEASETQVNGIEQYNLQHPGHVLKEKSLHEKPLQAIQETLEVESSQHFYTHPMELWSSLSQWIPQHALFQPSLHHQATLELSDTPAQTYPYQIDSSKNSRSGQGQHRHVRQGQHSKPYHPKPSLREIEIPKRPLFV